MNIYILLLIVFGCAAFFTSCFMKLLAKRNEKLIVFLGLFSTVSWLYYARTLIRLEFANMIEFKILVAMVLLIAASIAIVTVRIITTRVRASRKKKEGKSEKTFSPTSSPARKKLVLREDMIIVVDEKGNAEVVGSGKEKLIAEDIE